METKFFEIRDRATFMPVMAVRLLAAAVDLDGAEAWLMRRAGYGEDDILAGRFVILVTLSGGRGHAACDPYDWGSDTLTPAHGYIASHWADLETGQVIDAEHIRGESPAPKISERFDAIGPRLNGDVVKEGRKRLNRLAQTGVC